MAKPKYKHKRKVEAKYTGWVELSENAFKMTDKPDWQNVRPLLIYNINGVYWIDPTPEKQKRYLKGEYNAHNKQVDESREAT